jgi:TatD DNase family protein
MLIDSHCHLHFLDLTRFDDNLNAVITEARNAGVSNMLCVSTDLKDLPEIKAITDIYDNIFYSVGVHPNTELASEVTVDKLVNLTAGNSKCIAIGETGLDYYRQEANLRQQERFRAHIRAALLCQKPLIIHMREAVEDTLRILQEENARQIGGVLHCFSEDLAVARRVLDLDFYISFSGIVTFKNALQLQEVAKYVPLDRILIETDSPYLAPMPFRGKQNHPALVKQVALKIAELRNTSFEIIAAETSKNFFACFRFES